MMLVLASRSPRRAALLKQIGLEFTVVPGPEDEAPEAGGPAAAAEKLALGKARAVAEKMDRGLVIGADTIVTIEGEVLGKPRDADDARRMLARLSGRPHTVITGVAVVNAGTRESVVEHEESRVWFRTLDSEDIEAYVASGEPMDKAGAYGIQGLGAVFVERLEGCYSNVIGLPLPRLARILKSFGVDVLKRE